MTNFPTFAAGICFVFLGFFAASEQLSIASDKCGPMMARPCRIGEEDPVTCAKDADCKRGEACCPTPCGGTVCTAPLIIDEGGGNTGDTGGSDSGDTGSSDSGDTGGSDSGDTGGSDSGDTGGSDDSSGTDGSDSGDSGEVTPVVIVIKPGLCPRVPFIVRTQNYSCTSDADCPGSAKCCRTVSQGPSCVEPLSERKVGECPKVEVFPCFAPPEYKCQHDGECPGSNQRCCKEQCDGSQCTETVIPEPVTPAPLPPLLECPRERATECLNQQNPQKCRLEMESCMNEAGIHGICCQVECGGTECITYMDYPFPSPPAPECLPVDNSNCEGGPRERECETVADCPPSGGGTSYSCCETECNGTWCLGIAFAEPPPPMPPTESTCEPVPEYDPDFCSRVRVGRFCEKSSDCEPKVNSTVECCETQCGGSACVYTSSEPPPPPSEPTDPDCPVIAPYDPEICKTARPINECENMDSKCPAEPNTVAKCCPTMCGGSMCVRTPIPDPNLKPGMCPRVPIVIPSQEVNGNCSSDGDCPGEAKCCQTVSQGMNCVDPMAERKQGDCPPVKFAQCLAPPQYQCQHDGECSGTSMRCCQEPCGGTMCSQTVEILPPMPPPDEPFQCPPVKAIGCVDFENPKDCELDMPCLTTTGERGYCCPYECEGTKCVVAPTEPKEPGTCPPPPPFDAEKCAVMLPINECNNMDSNCGVGAKCCPTECNGSKCVAWKTPIPTDPSTCPVVRDVPMDECAARSTLNECNHEDSNCPAAADGTPGVCCTTECGGSQCLGTILPPPPPPSGTCPPPPPFDAEKCAVMLPINECNHMDSNCPVQSGTTAKCCPTECNGSKCVTWKTPIPTDPSTCPVVRDVPMEECAARSTLNECNHEDSNCPAAADGTPGVCCPTECGGSQCLGTIQPPPPPPPDLSTCPEVRDVPMDECAARTTLNECNHEDSNCPAAADGTPGVCCPTECGGSQCLGTIQPPPHGIPPRFGSCPADPGPPGPCGKDQCTSDQDCPGAQKCCRNSCNRVCRNPAGRIPGPPGGKPGNGGGTGGNTGTGSPGSGELETDAMCPARDPNMHIECARQDDILCSAEKPCPPDQMCCLTDCKGTACQPVEKPGMCRQYDWSVIGPCFPTTYPPDECSTDYECPDDLKCCVSPCSERKCMKPDPVVLPGPMTPVFIDGCDPLDPRIRCIRKDDDLCTEEKPCHPEEVCCPTNCGGTKCQAPGRPGMCPRTDLQMFLCVKPTPELLADECTNDTGCPEPQKCCAQVCTGKRCVQPAVLSDKQCRPVDTSVVCKKNEKPKCFSNRNCDEGTVCCATECEGSKCVPQRNTTLEKEGDCPPLNPFLDCVRLPGGCEDDSACEGTQKCCPVDCSEDQCVEPVRPGDCPEMPSIAAAGTCAEDCQGDLSCPVAGQKCCSNGCGHSCMDPVRKPRVTLDPNCPAGDPSKVCGTFDSDVFCYSTEECKPGDICCSTGCGGTYCYRPDTTEPVVKPGECPIAPVCGVPPPDGGCAGDDSCDGSLKCCRTDCAEPKCVQPVHAGQCPAPTEGVAAMCEDGAKNECEEDLDCASEDQKCCQNQCGVLTCQTAEYRSWTCPGVPEIGCATPYPKMCTNDSECGPRQKCCGDICEGTRCMNEGEPVLFPPMPPPNGDGGTGEGTEMPPKTTKAGKCPESPPGLITTCDVRCFGDDECPGDQLCCHWGCSIRCLDPETSSCPAVEDVPADECAARSVLNECSHMDANCPVSSDGTSAVCCPTECGGSRCVSRSTAGQPEQGTESPPKTIKAGNCPESPPDLMTTCDVKCSGDDACPGDQLCCHWGCSIRCLNPVPAATTAPDDSTKAVNSATGGAGDFTRVDDSKKTEQPPVNSHGTGDPDESTKGRGTENPLVNSPGTRVPDENIQGQGTENTPVDSRRTGNPDESTKGDGTKAPLVNSQGTQDSVESTEKAMTEQPPVASVEKEGLCPPYNPYLRCLSPPDACSDDSACPDEKKCCKTNCMGRQCRDPEKPGNCPPIRRNTDKCPANSKDQCDGDRSCPRDMKCCSDGCRRRCRNPDVKRLGQCPKFDDLKCPPSKDYPIKCEVDSDCFLRDMKCCPTFCRGTICKQAEIVTVKEGSCPAIFPELVDCRPDATKVDKCQTDADCVDNEKCCDTECDGKRCKQAQKRGFCPAVVMPADGCAQIDENNECKGDFDCKKGTKCCEQACTGLRCVDPEPNPESQKPGTCPPTNPDAMCPLKQIFDACRGDIDCQGDTMCCDTDCDGLQCVQPKNTFTFNPACPAPGDFEICIIDCSTDSDCSDGKVCCRNACGGGVCKLPASK